MVQGKEKQKKVKEVRHLFERDHNTLLHRRMSTISSTTTAQFTKQMGNDIPLDTDRRTILVWQPTSCQGRHLLKEGGNFIIS